MIVIMLQLISYILQILHFKMKKEQKHTYLMKSLKGYGKSGQKSNPLQVKLLHNLQKNRNNSSKVLVMLLLLVVSKFHKIKEIGLKVLLGVKLQVSYI